MTTDPLHKAVDTLSGLLKRVWELRQNGESTSIQAKALDQLVDQTVASILLLVGRGHETSVSHHPVSRSSSPLVKRFKSPRH